MEPIPLAHDVYTSVIARRLASSRSVNKGSATMIVHFADPALLKLEVRLPTLAPAMFSAAPGAPQPGRGDLNVLHPERGGSPDSLMEVFPFTRKGEGFVASLTSALYSRFSGRCPSQTFSTCVRALTPPSLAPFEAWERLSHCNGTDLLRRRA